MSTSPARRSRANLNGCEPPGVVNPPEAENLPEAEPGTLDGLWTPKGRRALALVLLLFLPAAPSAARPAADAAAEVQALVRQLKDKDEVVRLKAAKSLGKLGADAKDAVPALTEALEDPDEDVRSVAKQALAKIKAALQAADKGESLRQLARHSADAKSEDPAERRAGVRGLAGLLKCDDEVVRAKAARALGEAGAAAKPFVKELAAAAKDPDELVRMSARKALANVEAAAAAEKREQARAKVGPLVKGLKARQPAARVRALEAIGEMGEEGVEASEAVILALGDGAPAVQQAALDALEKVNPALHKPVLTILVDRTDAAKARAIMQLGQLGAGAKPALPLLFRLYQAQAGRLEMGLHQPFRITILDALKEIDPDDKRFAGLVLQAMSVTPAAARLSGLEGLVDVAVRKRAIVIAQELVKDKKLEADRLVKPLVSALNDPYCSLQAISALADLGVEARDAIPALTALKRNPDQATRDAAAEALKKIQ
jgi:HEAT repeat protein